MYVNIDTCASANEHTHMYIHRCFCMHRHLNVNNKQMVTSSAPTMLRSQSPTRSTRSNTQPGAPGLPHLEDAPYAGDIDGVVPRVEEAEHVHGGEDPGLEDLLEGLEGLALAPRLRLLGGEARPIYVYVHKCTCTYTCAYMYTSRLPHNHLQPVITKTRLPYLLGHHSGARGWGDGGTIWC